MIEVELKFQIPTTRRTALYKALDPKKSNVIQLQAKYFDTPSKLLSQSGVALRLRREGENWVQTLKAAGKSHLHRFEHNHDFGASEHAPNLDLTIYSQDSEAFKILQSALGEQFTELKLQFESDIQRTYRVIHFQEAEIEVSLDIGTLASESEQREVHEVEFELKQGSIQSLLAFSFEWVKKYQLWLDVRSKAEMGHLLSIQQPVSPAKFAKVFQ
ncbi:MAG: CYTH domain-containing protein, partial [Dysgonomonas sp.]